MNTVMKPVILLVGALTLAAPAFAQNAGAAAAAEDPRFAMLQTYCAECHNATDWAGGVAYDTMSASDVPHEIDVWESTVRKLRGNLMPPPGNKQPTQAQKDSLVGWLETSLDGRKETPRAGHVIAQRMSRSEYANAIRSLLGVEIKAEDVLPPEVEMEGFDNIAAALSISPSFLDQYIGAARGIAYRAVGSSHAKMGKTIYTLQSSETDNMPLGSSGGFRFKHFFPADGEYRLTILDDQTGGQYSVGVLFRKTIVVFYDGKLIFRGDVGGKEDLGLADREAGLGRDKVNARFANIPVKATSGVHEITVTTVERAHSLTDENIGGVPTSAASARTSRVEMSGPYGATTISSSPTRDRIFVCTPKSAAEEKPCAEKIARNLATKAYRRPATDADVTKLMAFFDAGRKDIGDFDGGVQEIVMGTISSPDFLYRIIQPKGSGPQPLTALELASRLSFFLWADLPDDELLKVAVSGQLNDPAVYDKQIDRMLADPRAQTLVTGFAMRWLNVDDLKAVSPDTEMFRSFSEGLRQDFSTEIRMFLAEALLQNRSVLELLSGNYTYVNERLARHYGIRGVVGTQFRRVQLSDDNRQGLLGKAAVLLRTSHGDRTSPVLRGAWVLEKLMGTPPTPPPPGVETNHNPTEGAAPTTLRARLELHREAKSCNQCHGVIDPIGLAMENFDAIGAYRTRDSGQPVDASTVLPNGQAINGVGQLRAAMLERPTQFVQTVTERLLMYGTGREVEAADMPQVRRIVASTAAGQYKFFDIVKGVAKSDAFRLQSPLEDHGDAKKTLASVAPQKP
jgi:mono/diheme cytochrome c family protein